MMAAFNKKRNQISEEESDSFCWVCDKKGPTLFCSTCVRSFHNSLECSESGHMSAKDMQKWRCAECIGIKKDEEKIRAKGIDAACLKTLLEMVYDRLEEDDDMRVHFMNVDYFSDEGVAVMPLDLEKIGEKVDGGEYSCLEAFFSDIKWIVHNTKIFRSVDERAVKATKQLLNFTKEELYSIGLCHECHMNANEHPDDWFTMVCKKQHLLVWAKMKSYPYWPAKVMSSDSNAKKIDVMFFGDHKRAVLAPKDCLMFSKSDPKNNSGSKKLLEQAKQEALKYIENVNAKFGADVCKLLETPVSLNMSELKQKSAPGMEIDRHVKKTQSATMETAKDVSTSGSVISSPISNPVRTLHSNKNESMQSKELKNVPASSKSILKRQLSDVEGVVNQKPLKSAKQDSATSTDTPSVLTSAIRSSTPKRQPSEVPNKTIARKRHTSSRTTDAANDEEAQLSDILMSEVKQLKEHTRLMKNASLVAPTLGSNKDEGNQSAWKVASGSTADIVTSKDKIPIMKIVNKHQSIRTVQNNENVYRPKAVKQNLVVSKNGLNSSLVSSTSTSQIIKVARSNRLATEPSTSDGGRQNQLRQPYKMQPLSIQSRPNPPIENSSISPNFARSNRLATQQSTSDGIRQNQVRQPYKMQPLPIESRSSSPIETGSLLPNNARPNRSSLQPSTSDGIRQNQMRQPYKMQSLPIESRPNPPIAISSYPPNVARSNRLATQPSTSDGIRQNQVQKPYKMQSLPIESRPNPPIGISSIPPNVARSNRLATQPSTSDGGRQNQMQQPYKLQPLPIEVLPERPSASYSYMKYKSTGSSSAQPKLEFPSESP